MRSRRVVLLGALLCLAGYVYVYASGLAWPPIRSDGFSYYIYLPSWFLFRDPTLASASPCALRSTTRTIGPSPCR